MFTVLQTYTDLKKCHLCISSVVLSNFIANHITLHNPVADHDEYYLPMHIFFHPKWLESNICKVLWEVGNVLQKWNIGLPAARADIKTVNVFQVVFKDQFYVRKVCTMWKWFSKLTENFTFHYDKGTYFKIVSELSSAFLWYKINHTT